MNATFLQRAARILWLYERVDSLWVHDEIVLALDEKPNIQALGRARPAQPMHSGQVERQEFEYIRHGTVNFLALLNVHNGHMRSGFAVWTKMIASIFVGPCPNCFDRSSNFVVFT